jgi:hypothetical protein
MLDLDYGEGMITFTWQDPDQIQRSLTIDVEGFCFREMPISSGHGVTFAAIQPERLRLRFTDELANKLELDQEIEFSGPIPENVLLDLCGLSERL